MAKPADELSNEELIDACDTSIHFLAWDVDEYVEPEFEDKEQQATFEEMYSQLYDNLGELLKRFKRVIGQPT